MLKELKIEGRSGCKLEILKPDNCYFVKKISGSTSYNLRLKKQCEKQNAFANKNDECHPFYAPRINGYNFPSNKGLAEFSMEYLPGEIYSEFLERCTVNQLNTLIDEFFLFLQKAIDNSVDEHIDKQIFLTKINSINQALHQKKIHNPVFKNVIEFLTTNILSAQLPIGFCHGDLTLSNIIISDNKVYLIDFLDTFIESPLLDIVKIRQDTKFYWSLLLGKNTANYQRLKIIQALKYFDNKIVKRFSSLSSYSTWYEYLEKLNLMRILPYLNDKKEIDFVEKCLTQTED
ncbi:MAG: phosphotransferase [Bacteroidetes bacterium]|nr:phosphotransferase [Bacteroidota bacterium]